MKFSILFGICLTILAKRCQETYGLGVALNDGSCLASANVQVDETSSETYESYESSDSTTSSNGFNSDFGVSDFQSQLGQSLGKGISSNGLGLNTLTGGTLDLQKQVGNFQSSATSCGDKLKGTGLNSLTGGNLDLQKQLGSLQSTATSYGNNLKGTGLNSLTGTGLNSLTGGNLDLQKQVGSLQSTATSCGDNLKGTGLNTLTGGNLDLQKQLQKSSNSFGNELNKLSSNLGVLGGQNSQVQNQYSESYDFNQESSSYNYDDLNQGSGASGKTFYSPQIKLNDGGCKGDSGFNKIGVPTVAIGVIPSQGYAVSGNDYLSSTQESSKLGQGIAYQPSQGISLPQNYLASVPTISVITESYTSSDESDSEEISIQQTLPGGPQICPQHFDKHHKKPHPPKKHKKNKGPCHKKDKKPKHEKKTKSCHKCKKCKKPEPKKSKCGCGK